MNFARPHRTTSSITRLCRIGIAVLSFTTATFPLQAEDRLTALQQAVVQGPDADLVLNLMELGVEAIYRRAYDIAEESFDRALTRIEAVYANNERAARARSLWVAEGSKDFKGEPYERTMAYYYRGLLYLRSGDCDNAHASFRSGLIQDSFAEEEQYRSDSALLYFLSGWASRCSGNESLAVEEFGEAMALRPGVSMPAEGSNLLLLVETGRAPRKVGDGKGLSELKFRRGRNFLDEQASARVHGGALSHALTEDMFFQASTRGGRQVDKILDRKAHFVDQKGTAGSENMEMAGMNAEGGAGAAQSAIAAIQFATAAAAKPRADTRYWRSLPDRVHLFVGKGVIEGDEVEVRYLDHSGADVTGMKGVRVTLDINSKGLLLGWVRSHPPGSDR